jgi:hypothetical protein
MGNRGRHVVLRERLVYPRRSLTRDIKYLPFIQSRSYSSQISAQCLFIVYVLGQGN